MNSSDAVAKAFKSGGQAIKLLAALIVRYMLFMLVKLDVVICICSQALQIYPYHEAVH